MDSNRYSINPNFIETSIQGFFEPEKRIFKKVLLDSNLRQKFVKKLKLGIFLKLENFWNRQHSRFNLSASGFREEKNWKKPNLILTR